MTGSRSLTIAVRFVPVVAMLLGCRGAPRPLPEGALVLRVEGPAPLAYVDEQPVTLYPGRATRISVPGGLRRIEVRAPGHFTAYREAYVPPRGRVELTVPLRPDPDAEPSAGPPRAQPFPESWEPR